MPLRRLTLAALVSSLAIGAPAAIADPDPAVNKNALVRTLVCDNGETIVASFAGLEGSNFNVTTDERVFVYKWIHIDRPPVGVEGPNDDLNVRGLQGVSADRLVTCRYVTGSGNVVEAIGIFTGQPS
jgi:hypothetical protein